MNEVCQYCKHNICIHRVPIFSTLSKEALFHIIPLIQRSKYEKGQRLVSEGDSIDSLIIINHGSVKAFKTTPDGREQILYVFSEGDFFGETNLLGNQRSNYHVEALENVFTCALNRTQFETLIRTHPEIALKIIEELGRRINAMEASMQSIGVRSINARIAALLCEYQEKFSENTESGIILHLPLSREGMANSLGIARETLSRKLGQFESKGIIRSLNNKTMMVLQPEELQNLAGYSE
jgi:CRP/FNR family transcriptional regulator